MLVIKRATLSRTESDNLHMQVQHLVAIDSVYLHMRVLKAIENKRRSTIVGFKFQRGCLFKGCSGQG